MDISTSIKTCFSKYVTFSGRAQRSEFWWWVLFIMITNVILTIVDSTLFGTVTTGPGSFEASTEMPVLSGIFGLVTLLPSISVAVRRLHDTDRSGWWYWIALVPLVGFIFLIVWFASEGTRGQNRYGRDPLDGPRGSSGGGFSYDDPTTPSRIPTVSND